MKNQAIIKTEPSTLSRWMVLLFLSIAMFGNYYVFDSIALVADQLKSGLGFSDFDIGQLYSAYSLAAIIVLVFGGVLVDKWGTKKSAIVFAAICTISGFLVAFSSNLYLMLAGRFLLGIGSEPLIVAITVAIAKWFKAKELSFAMGINLLVARSGTVAVDNSPTVFPGLYSGGYSGPLFLAAVIGILSFIGILIYYILESSGEKKFKLSGGSAVDKLNLKDFFKYNKSFWYITLLCVTFYSGIFPFRSFAVKFFMESHNISRESAGWMISMLPLSAMIATPLIGLLVDFIGKRATLMMIGSILLMPVYLLMAYSGVTLYVPVIMMGVAFSLIPAVMWPAVAYIVKENRLGSGYALMTLIQQIGMMIFPVLIGATNDYAGASAAHPQGYNPGMWIFSILGFLGFIFAFLLRKAETGPKGHGLEEGMKHKQDQTSVQTAD
ncbi:MAG TPA: MFS transporter [Ignavibacteriaceae bacterium]|nr:MFS transporter [Ignavibacteriaceae bacterium]